jgi:hypothetical protein
MPVTPFASTKCRASRQVLPAQGLGVSPGVANHWMTGCAFAEQAAVPNNRARYRRALFR